MSARGSSYIKRPFDFLLVVIEDKRVNYGAFSLLLKRRQRKCTPKPTDTEVVYVPLKRVPTTTGHVSCLSIKKDLGWHIWGHTEHNFFWQYTLISDKSNMAFFFYWLTPSLYCKGMRVSEPKKWLVPNFIFKGWEWCIWTLTTIIHHQVWSADSTAET